ncbi:MAG: hypothetical protein AAF728_10825, partial [Cyanobacteria bacterium P01_D01_bin.128]
SAGGIYAGVTFKVNELFNGFGLQMVSPPQQQESYVEPPSIPPPSIPSVAPPPVAPPPAAPPPAAPPPSEAPTESSVIDGEAG